MDMHAHTSTMVHGEHSLVELLKFAGILAAITIAATTLHVYLGAPGLAGWLRWFMGAFFLVFGSFKLIGYKMFAEMFSGYDVIAKRSKLYVYCYPFIELALAVAYLTSQFSPGRDWVTLVIMSIGSVGVAQELKHRTGIHCACLGNVIKLPLSTVSLVEDVGMGIMAAVMLVR